MPIRQVVTERDWYIAVLDYMMEQIDGRFRMEFKNHGEEADLLIAMMSDEDIRQTADSMRNQIDYMVSYMGRTVTDCSLNGCPHTENHYFIREFINLVWDARHGTEQWLNQQGIVPGQSAN